MEFATFAEYKNQDKTKQNSSRPLPKSEYTERHCPRKTIFFFPETGFLCVVLAVLELIL